MPARRPTPRTSPSTVGAAARLAQSTAQVRRRPACADSGSRLVSSTSSTTLGCGRRDRCGGEGREVLVVAGEAVGDLATGDHRSDRVAGTHRLAQRDEVGRDPGGREAPQLRAAAAEAGLDLVGEEQGAGAVGAVDESGEELGRSVEDALAGEADVGQHAVPGGRPLGPGRRRQQRSGRRAVARSVPPVAWPSGRRRWRRAPAGSRRATRWSSGRPSTSRTRGRRARR